MDAVDFLKGYTRMCHYYQLCQCDGCPLDSEGCNIIDYDTDERREYIIEIIEEWVKEHPVRTRQSEFLKLFPNALCGSVNKEYLDICPLPMTGRKPPMCSQDCNVPCQNCFREFWLEEI